jgi:tRNA (guanine37-N1)-methyltransferase
MLRFDIITLFGSWFEPLTSQGICGRACQRGLWQLRTWSPRDHAHDVHRTIDDRPFGGGPGMVMMAGPLADTLAEIRADHERSALPQRPVVLLSPQGRRFHQAMAHEWAQSPGRVLVCGRYEGVDQRFIDRYVDEEVSLGDFVLSGGELAAMAFMDATVRLLPGALKDPESARQDSFESAQDGLLDCPHYTRPEVFDGEPVPEVLMSGHHARIARWRREQSLLRTAQRRPDLLQQALEKGLLSPEDRRYLASLPDGLAAR